jgi:hypothetical protein
MVSAESRTSAPHRAIRPGSVDWSQTMPNGCRSVCAVQPPDPSTEDGNARGAKRPTENRRGGEAAGDGVRVGADSGPLVEEGPGVDGDLHAAKVSGSGAVDYCGGDVKMRGSIMKRPTP